MTSAPAKLTKADSGGWRLWEKLVEGRPQFGNPSAFNACIAQSCWESFTVTLKNPAFFEQMTQFSGNSKIVVLFGIGLRFRHRLDNAEFLREFLGEQPQLIGAQLLAARSAFGGKQLRQQPLRLVQLRGQIDQHLL
jgi:hypothetical protein